jgi:hypothetical protein
MTAALLRVNYLAFCCVAIIVVPAPAIACVLANPAEFLGSAVTLAVRFWLASFFLGALILCLDIYERRLSIALPLAGWVLLLWGAIVCWQAIAGTTGYSSDCTVPLVELSQYVLGLTSALFGFRAFQAARSPVRSN